MKPNEIIEQKYKKVSCLFCSSSNVIKRGIRKKEHRGKVQRFGCKDCCKIGLLILLMLKQDL